MQKTLLLNLFSYSQVFRFAQSKNESLFLQRKNPRKIAWTILYRRMHKKGVTEEVAKKRSRKTVKHQRGIVGADMNTILARRNQTAATRASARQQAVSKAKEEKKAKEATKAKTKVRSLYSFALEEAEVFSDCPASYRCTQGIQTADEGRQGWTLNCPLTLMLFVYSLHRSPLSNHAAMRYAMLPTGTRLRLTVGSVFTGGIAIWGSSSIRTLSGFNVKP
jgi:hypothetical protein